MTVETSSGTGRLRGQVALVTAAGQGIGRAIAERLIAEGAIVHASDLRPDLLADLAGAASTAALDATDLAATEAWVAAAGPRIDTVVAAVGWVHHGSIEECSPEDWRRSGAITLDSVYHTFRAAVPRMKTHGGSAIAIASVASSIKGFASRAAYGTAKAGVIGLVKACAADYLKAGVRFNAVCPGTVDSPSLRERIAALAPEKGGLAEAEAWFLGRQPAGRFGTPEEIAGVCAFLASDEARFMTGQAIRVDGGITI
jgi:2-keto-3-deoxy-L-fuconate dehydrogenase